MNIILLYFKNTKFWKSLRKMDFYHGSSNSFDQFDSERIVTRADHGAVENGYGTYFTTVQGVADRWAGRNAKNDGTDKEITMRIRIDDETCKNNFIQHDKIFTQDEAIRLAVAAANGGYHQTAEQLTDIIRRGDVTGKELAEMTRTNLESVRFLSSLGYAGFSYEGSSAGKFNIAIFDTANIPSTLLVNSAQGFTANICANGKTATSSLPPALQIATDLLLQKIDLKVAELSYDPKKLEGAKSNILLLAQAAANMTKYEPSSEIHPLKVVYLAMLDTGEYDPSFTRHKVAAEILPDIENFIQNGMRALGHSHAPFTLSLAPPVIPTVPESTGYDHYALQNFAKRLESRDFIASETLQDASRSIHSAYPALGEGIDRLIDHTHAPRLAGSGFIVRDTLGNALKGIIRSDITPEQAVKKIEAIVRDIPHDTQTLIHDVMEFSKSLQTAVNKPAEPISQPQPAVPTTSRFGR